MAPALATRPADFQASADSDVLQGAPLSGIRIGLLLVLVACNTAGAAKYGETCSLDTDCEEKRAPHCQVFFEDTSYEHNEM